jgi:uncharacterized membrane protein
MDSRTHVLDAVRWSLPDRRGLEHSGQKIQLAFVRSARAHDFSIRVSDFRSRHSRRPPQPTALGGGLEGLAFSAGAFSLAAGHTEAWRQQDRYRVLTLARFIIAVAITFFGVEQVLHPEFAPGVPLAKLTPLWIPVHLLWGYATGAVFVVGGVCLLINKQARLGAAWLGLVTLLLVIIIYVPIVVADPSDIGNAFNYLVDTLLLSGTLLALAGALSPS